MNSKLIQLMNDYVNNLDNISFLIYSRSFKDQGKGWINKLDKKYQTLTGGFLMPSLFKIDTIHRVEDSLKVLVNEIINKQIYPALR